MLSIFVPSSRAQEPVNRASPVPTLTMRRHIHTRLRRNSVLAPPQTRHSLLLRIELQARFPIKRIRASTSYTLLIAREAEHRQRHGDGHIDAELADIADFLEACCGAAAAGEDGGAVAVIVCVYESDGFVEGGDVEADEDGAENFFRVATHVGFDVGDYCWADLEGVSCLMRDFGKAVK